MGVGQVKGRRVCGRIKTLHDKSAERRRMIFLDGFERFKNALLQLTIARSVFTWT
jgi:hypothetical protein